MLWWQSIHLTWCILTNSCTFWNNHIYSFLFQITIENPNFITLKICILLMYILRYYCTRRCLRWKWITIKFAMAYILTRHLPDVSQVLWTSNLCSVYECWSYLRFPSYESAVFKNCTTFDMINIVTN
jgi:hypothetical protein